jgi:hypothetical protein
MGNAKEKENSSPILENGWLRYEIVYRFDSVLYLQVIG